MIGGMYSTTRYAKLNLDFSYVISLSLRLDPLCEYGLRRSVRGIKSET